MICKRRYLNKLKAEWDKKVRKVMCLLFYTHFILLDFSLSPKFELLLTMHTLWLNFFRLFHLTATQFNQHGLLNLITSLKKNFYMTKYFKCKYCLYVNKTTIWPSWFKHITTNTHTHHHHHEYYTFFSILMYSFTLNCTKGT